MSKQQQHHKIPTNVKSLAVIASLTVLCTLALLLTTLYTTSTVQKQVFRLTVRKLFRANVSAGTEPDSTFLVQQDGFMKYPTLNKRVAILTIGLIKPDTAVFMRYMYWVTVASKQAYAVTYGYPMYVASQLSQGRHAAWDKLLAIKAVMQHSGAEWVWCTDLDAAIMNLAAEVEDIIHQALSTNRNTSAIVARDCNGFNTGSYIVKNTNWTFQHMSDAWALYGNQEVQSINVTWEQAALIHLYNARPEVRTRYFIAKQKQMNAYPDFWNCNDDSGHYQEGDFVMHFPNHNLRKTALTTERYLEWFNSVPIHGVTAKVNGTSSAVSQKFAHVFKLTGAHLASCQPNGQSADDMNNANATMMRKLYGARADDIAGDAMQTADCSKKEHLLVDMTSTTGQHDKQDFCISVEHAPVHTSNPGWPLEQPALMAQHAGVSQRSQRVNLHL